MRSRVAIMAALTLAGCASSAHSISSSRSVATRSGTISGVGVEPKTLERRKPGEVTIRYELSEPSEVVVDLVDDAGRVAQTLKAGRQPAGRRAVTWDGRAADGTPVPSGVYRYVIHAKDRQGREAVYDPSSITGGEELQPKSFTFDRGTGTLRWSMPKAGRARLRFAVQGFPHLRTLLDWEPLEAGPQEVVWDGLDASGLVRAIEHPNLAVKLNAFALPDNTIIIRGGSPAASRQQRRAAYPPEHRPTAAYLHARHPREVCHEAALSIEFPPGTAYDDHGRPRLTGTVPVRIVLNPSEAASLVDQRFEVALFEDLTQLFEEEEGVNPFTFLWETGRLAPGEHVLTVNILSYDDHYGLLTRPVMIERNG